MAVEGHCYLMMDDLQQAYSAYQQALYHLRDPKVLMLIRNHAKLTLTTLPGTKALVWYRDSLRSLRLARACRRGIFASHAYAARF